MDKKQYDREYHANRSLEAKKRKVRLQRERVHKIKKQLIEYKKTKSCECGETHVACLDFHHIDGTKEINIGDALSHGWPFERILTEIKKCIIVCANCHRKIHYKK